MSSDDHYDPLWLQVVMGLALAGVFVALAIASYRQYYTTEGILP